MTMLLELAWRNLWRRRRRSLITMSSVAFGVFFSATFVGVRNHSHGSLVQKSVRMGFGHVSIVPHGYNVSPSLDKRIAGADRLRDRALGVPGVTKAIARISGPAIFSSAAGSAPGMIMGIDPAQESSDVNAYLAGLREGQLFGSSEGRGAVIGQGMAKRLGLEIGRKLVYTAIDANGAMIAESVRVEGIFTTGLDDADSSAVLVPIDTLRKVLQYGAGEATMVSVFVGAERDAATVAEQMRADGHGPFEISTWRETQPGLAAYVALDGSMDDVFLLLIVLVVAAGVLNTMIVSVLERKRELGVMLAVGISPGRLFRLIVCEATLLACVGLIAGSIAFIPWMFYMQRIGIDLSRFIGSDIQISGVLYDPILRIALHPWDPIYIVLALYALVFVTAAYPAYRAARLPPIDSMRQA